VKTEDARVAHLQMERTPIERPPRPVRGLEEIPAGEDVATLV
jgi:hypothetical protein